MGGFLFPEQWLSIPGMGGFFAPVYALTHVFVKTTARVPTKEIQKAKEYRTVFLSRLDESDLEAMKDDI